MKTALTNIITDELLNPTFEMTRQYLKILEIKYEDTRPKIAKIEIKKSENQATAYIELKNVSFYLAFIFDTISKIEISAVDTAPFIGITFLPTSEELTLQGLLNLTTIMPTKTISKGDFFSNGKFQYSYNGLEFNTTSEPDKFGSKLNSLLNFLETDIEGVKELSRQTNCKDLFVTVDYHIGNGNFTGIYLDNQAINRLSKLGLQLTFDIYATGNRFATK